LNESKKVSESRRSEAGGGKKWQNGGMGGREEGKRVDATRERGRRKGREREN